MIFTVVDNDNDDDGNVCIKQANNNNNYNEYNKRPQAKSKGAPRTNNIAGDS
uniref:GK21605 n=1 Tax=Drosophila willistoni TaxID=7260 RepID=B4MPG1_DROWI